MSGSTVERPRIRARVRGFLFALLIHGVVVLLAVLSGLLLIAMIQSHHLSKKLACIVTKTAGETVQLMCYESVRNCRVVDTDETTVVVECARERK